MNSNRTDERAIPTDVDDSPGTVTRRSALLAGTAAVLLTACDPLPGGDGDAADSPDLLAFTPDKPLVDDGQGNTEPDNEGVFDNVGDGMPGDGDTTGTTRPGQDRTPSTGGSSTTTSPRRGSPTTGSTNAPSTTNTTTTSSTNSTTASTSATTATTVAATSSTIANGEPRQTTTTGGSVSTSATTPTTVPPPPPLASPRHATSRLTFGITPAVDMAVITMGVGPWIEDQLARSGPDEAVEAQLRASGYQSLDNTTAQNRARYESDVGLLYRELTHSAFYRARYSQNQLFETMCQLWMDHLNISYPSVPSFFLPEYQETVIRAHAMGRFVDLLTASANSGGMMRYLDNYRSDARSGINENYGREILELHSLGIDRNGNQIYTELDVVGVAKVFSGWSIDPSGSSPSYGAFVYRPEYHSPDPVSILGGQWTNAGRSGKSAGDNLLGFLARHPQTANYVSWKLCRRFVSDTPSEQLIAGAARVYLQNDTAIVPVLRYIFASQEFVDSPGDKVRRPFELMSGALRAMGTDVPVDSESNASHQLRNYLRSLGHEPWQWETPDGYPDEGEPWVNSNSLLRQWSFTARLARDNLQSNSQPGSLVTDVSQLRGAASTGRDLFDRVAFHCNLGTLPDGTRSSLLSLIGFNDNTPAASVSDDDLAELCTYLLAHPLFLLR